MTTPISIPLSTPQERPQPDQVRYDLTELYLFNLYDRAGYQQAFGQDPPSYDPSRPTKLWFDSSAAAATAPVDYEYYDGTMTQQKFTLSPAEASTVNVWGVHPYPVYAPAATTATRSGVSMPPTILSTKAQADALAARWKVPPIDETTVNFDSDTYPAGETRRPWAIQFMALAGTPVFYVGEQIALQNALGVGAPGHWDLTGAIPQWVSDIPPQPTTQNPEGPIPMRALKANESLVSGGMMDPGPYVERTDLAPPGTVPAQSASGLTDAQAQSLQRIEDRVNAIAQRFGIS